VFDIWDAKMIGNTYTFKIVNNGKTFISKRKYEVKAVVNGSVYQLENDPYYPLWLSLEEIESIEQSQILEI
jgi:hypothetical protein